MAFLKFFSPLIARRCVLTWRDVEAGRIHYDTTAAQCRRYERRDVLLVTINNEIIPWVNPSNGRRKN